MDENFSNDDCEQMIKTAVKPFVQSTIIKLTERHEIPLELAKLNNIIKELIDIGILPSSDEGFGIWEIFENLNHNKFSILSLKELSYGNASVAYLSHNFALSNLIVKKLQIPKLNNSKIIINIQGHYALSRYSLAKYLNNRETESDVQNLKNYFVPQPPYGIIVHTIKDWTHLLHPFINENGIINWKLFSRSELNVRELYPSHGLDALQSYFISFNNEQSYIYQSELNLATSKQLYNLIFKIYQLGLIAIVVGRLKRAISLSEQYVTIRKQGGKLLIEYPAVQLLIHRSNAVLKKYEKLLDNISSMKLDEIISIRIKLYSDSANAVNDSLQAFGGMGYMQDTGMEKILRDINHINLIGGTNTELTLFLSALSGLVNGDIITKTESSINGFVPPTHELSPRTAFNKISRLTRFLIQYKPEKLWDEDTNKLPRSLRKLRRKSKKFADKYIRPISMKIDQLPHKVGELPPEQEKLLKIAAKKGLMTDLLPWPIGSGPISQIKHSFALRTSIKIEEHARACGGLMLMLSAHHLGVAPILLSGDLHAIIKFLLPAYRENKKGKPHIFAFAITEPNAGSDVEETHGASKLKPGVIAKKTKGGWILNGRKIFISGGAIAKSITLFASLENEGIESWTCFLVTSDMKGFEVTRTELKMGMRASDAAELNLTDVFVPDKNIIGGLRKGWALNRAVLNLSRVPVASMAVGLAQSAIDLVMDFACNYEVNGNELINYQEIQLELAQMIAETSSIRNLVWNSAREWIPKQRTASINKFLVTDTAMVIIERAMRIFSNHGMLFENKIEKIFRDVRLTRIFEGTNDINRLAVIEDTQEEFINMMKSEYKNRYGDDL